MIDGFLDDLNDQLDSLGILNGTDLLDRLRNLIDKLDEWRDYLQDQLEEDTDSDGGMPPTNNQDDPPDVWRGDEDEEWEEPPPVFCQEDEPEYAWSDPDPQLDVDERD